MLQGFPTQGKYKVLVRCNTFNQAKYIEDALKGFAIQHTDFPFLVYVIDDASTDGEQDILKEWIEVHCLIEEIKTYDNDIALILMAKDKENENCIYAFHLLKKNLYCKPEKQEIHKFWREQCEYEAICEGDDYWITENHLQSKVNWLDSHTDYAACVNNIKIVFAGPYPFRKVTPCPKDTDLTIEDIIYRKIFFQTASLIIRQDIYSKRNKELPEFSVGDYPLYVYAAYNGKIRMQSDYMTAYRVGVPGSANTSGITKNKDILLKRLTDSHYMLETLNSYTQFQYDSLFKNRWYINLMRYCKHTQQYGQMRKAFSRITDRIETMGLKWTIGHFLGCYFRLFDLHILK